MGPFPDQFSMIEGGGQRIGVVDNSEGWGGMVQYMPGSRERSARQSGGGKGGRKAVRGHIHSCDKPMELLCSLGFAVHHECASPHVAL